MALTDGSGVSFEAHLQPCGSEQSLVQGMMDLPGYGVATLVGAPWGAGDGDVELSVNKTPDSRHANVEPEAALSVAQASSISGQSTGRTHSRHAYVRSQGRRLYRDGAALCDHPRVGTHREFEMSYAPSKCTA